MKPIPITRLNHLTRVTSTLEAHGVSAERTLAESNLPNWVYGDPEAFVPLRHVLLLLRAGSRELGTDRFGLLVGSANSVDKFSIYGQRISRSLTLYDAVRTACIELRNYTPAARLWVSETNDTVWFCRGQLAGIDTGLRQLEQYTLSVLIRIVQLGAGANWLPADVCVCTHGQPRLEKSDPLSKANVRYGQPFTAVAIPKSIVSRPLRQQTQPRAPNGCSGAELDWSTMPAGDFVGSIRQVVKASIPLGVPEVQTMAEIIGTSVRTLQRRLSHEGSSFSKIVDQARYQAARELLEEGGASIRDIAYDVGFENAPDFTRAFRRWAGVAPSEYLAQRTGNEINSAHV